MHKTPSDKLANAKETKARPSLRFLGTCDCSWSRLRNVDKIDLVFSFPLAVPQLDEAQNLKAVTLSNQQPTNTKYSPVQYNLIDYSP